MDTLENSLPRMLSGRDERAGDRIVDGRSQACGISRRGPNVMAALRTFVSLLLLCITADAAAARCSDLALVLAIDSSGSIDDREFALQQKGYADAFRNKRVLAALKGVGTVDVAVVLWGDSTMPVQVLPWQRLDRAAGAERIAQKIEDVPRHVTGNTAMGTGLWVALDLLDDPARCADRTVINVSGDGMESLGPRPGSVIPLGQSRARALASGVTINALVISNGNEILADWFRSEVITGPGSFVMQVNTFAHFAETITEKLVREINAPVFAAIAP
jgi:hypothetical protein